jgi:glutamate N-acetyltransferase/amino-acid N-acetyltransferase
MIRSVKGGVTAPLGFSAGAVRAGIKELRGADLGLVASDRPCVAAGAFTRNSVRAACVDRCRRLLPSTAMMAILCNSGNANACTGRRGEQDTARMASLVAQCLGVRAETVLVASTGIIGHYLPMDKVRAGIASLGKVLTPRHRGGTDFAEAIMTTDTRRKEAAVRVATPAGRFAIGGCAKGSGMVHPDMATMLAFITTDAAIGAGPLRRIVRRVVDWTFNNLTVDGDTSTNDMVLVLANGCSNTRLRSANDLVFLEKALLTVCSSLCAQMAADGEGATKRIEVNVVGAQSYRDAKLAAKTIANSNLVKTAIFGNDPNWGRVVCAIGYSGARFSRNDLTVAIGGIPVCRALRPVAFSRAAMQRALRRKVVVIDVVLGRGQSCAVAHTCDLTYDYIRINAEYHT